MKWNESTATQKRKSAEGEKHIAVEGLKKLPFSVEKFLQRFPHINSIFKFLCFAFTITNPLLQFSFLLSIWKNSGRMSWGKFSFILHSNEEGKKLYLKTNFLCNVLWVFWGWFPSASSTTLPTLRWLRNNTPRTKWLISEIFSFAISTIFLCLFKCGKWERKSFGTANETGARAGEFIDTLFSFHFVSEKIHCVGAFKRHHENEYLKRI